jgi:hypothetical protein
MRIEVRSGKFTAIFAASRRANVFCGLLLLLAMARAGGESAQPNHRPTRGYSYSHDQIPEGPWSIHILKVDRANPNLELQTTLAKGSTFGLTTLSDQIKTLPPELGAPVAAINGDYYTSHKPYLGDPKGLQILQGELVSAPCDWTCFWIDPSGRPRMTNVVSEFRITWPDGSTTPFGLNEERTNNGMVLFTPRIGSSTRASGGIELILENDGAGPWLPLRPGLSYRARVRTVRDQGDSAVAAGTMVLSISPQLISHLPKPGAGLSLQISTATTPDLKGVETAMGGGPALVRDGKAIKMNGAEVRHPRTAIGWNKTHFFMVEIDGRQPSLSVGMTLSELAAHMIKLGCEEAMNLDGGGSSTFWVYGQVMNSPSEGHERGMANALVLIQKRSRPTPDLRD